ncbi:hypothetical protein HMPREF9622_01590 [Cutibacterium modestum HL037PA3]|nr:hypothetical protein HMPREF9621_01625 [Cutibacterium modestum HL037PA2]EFT15384.1 hypothetical protein HMPREF9622_01590 [Cutibacterium modestum HL037PA3]
MELGIIQALTLTIPMYFGDCGGIRWVKNVVLFRRCSAGDEGTPIPENDAAVKKKRCN